MKGGRSTRPRSGFLGLCCCFVIGLYIFWYLLDAPPVDKPVVVTPLPNRENMVSAEAIRDRAANMFNLRVQYDKPENQATVALIRERCAQLTQHEQLLDIECTSVWLNRLRSGPITGVDKWWGFHETHNGAITLTLGNMRAMFKPCSSKSEDTSKEVIASYIDQLLQWGQTAPVITRRIPIDLLEGFLNRTSNWDVEAFEETKANCAKNGNFEGPMIGWWDSLIPIRTMNKKELPIPDLVKMRPQLAKSRLPTQMQSKYHAFYLLINILRHGKDEFITKHGDLVSLDLDRSRFQSTKPLTSSAVNYTWCFTCYMDRWVYDTFQAVGPKQPESERLGYLMRSVLMHEDIFEDIWSSSLGKALDTRVAMLLDCVDDCIRQYGEENVLLNEPYDSMTAREKVEWFYEHSEYKNMNGKRGPTNLDFLNDL